MTKEKHILVCFIILILSFSTSCIQTKTLVTNPDEALTRVKAPLYCGTFSSYVNYGKDNSVTFNDSISRLSNLIYDSIIRQNFKKIPRLKLDFVSDSAEAVLLSKEFVNLIEHANKNESIKKYNLSNILDRLTQNYEEERFMFMVPTGYTRSLANMRELGKKQRDTRTVFAIIGSAMATALSGGTAIYLFIPTGGRIHAQGSNCHLMVYNKTTKQITFYRQQFFTWDNVRPLEKKYLKKQAQYLLKEYL
ncbi:MAG: hypothetical protein IT236_12590 [Bacteroidia bacterium]|nr:hypothetical protein [Bacteroidia bacterium]